MSCVLSNSILDVVRMGEGVLIRLVVCEEKSECSREAHEKRDEVEREW